MKRLLLLFALLAFASTSYAQRVKIPCPTTLNDINDSDPVKGFKVGSNTRERIQALGEGKKIVVVANALRSAQQRVM